MFIPKDLIFMIASYLKFEEILKIFEYNIIERDKIINLYNYKVPTIRDACIAGKLIIFKYLYEIMQFTDDDFTEANKNTLCDGRGSLDIIKYLISKNITFDVNSLNTAIRYNKLEIVKYFIELGIKIDYYSWNLVLNNKCWLIGNYLKTIELPNFNHLNHFLYQIINPGFDRTQALISVKYLLDNNLIMCLEFDNLDYIFEPKHILKLKFEYSEIYSYILSKTIY